jgi:hypothetical protein
VLASWTYEYKLLERPEPKDHIVVRFTDGEVRSAQTNPCPKKEAFETKARWDKDGLLSPQDRGYEYRVMKLVEADA